MKQSFFSVIIPTLNEEDYLPNLFSDLEKQIYKNFEIIVVDGGSTDKTVTIAEKFKKKLPLRLFISPKRNVSYQRNLGAKKSLGKFLIFLDADTRINTGFLKNIFSVLNKKEALLIIPKIIPNEVNKKTPEMKVLFEIVNFFIETSQLINKPFSSGGSIIIEKNLFNFLEGFDESLYLAEDHNLIQRAKKSGVTAKMFPLITAKFNLRRMKHEGRFKFLYKSIIATFHIVLKGDIKKRIFDYQMGGGYLKESKLNKISVVDVRKYLGLLKKVVKKF
jgi:glycosyltransferase involved in cell wall biosynthesis